MRSLVLRYGISYRDLTEIIQERELKHTVHDHALEWRSIRAAHRLLSKAAVNMRDWTPTSITTDKLPSYPEAIDRPKREGKLARNTRHRKSKYMNNIIEADHGALKKVIRPTRGFQTIRTATAIAKKLRDHAHDLEEVTVSFAS